MTATTFYHHFRGYKNHNDYNATWLGCLPKKLGTSIPLDDDQREFGWGIHIIEGLNLHFILIMAFINVISSLCLALTYSTCTEKQRPRMDNRRLDGDGIGTHSVQPLLPLPEPVRTHINPHLTIHHGHQRRLLSPFSFRTSISSSTQSHSPPK